MKHLCACLSLMLALAPAPRAQEQKARVRTEYMKSAKKTRVEANVLFVLNAPDQFLQLQLRAWHKGQQLDSPAEQIELDFVSFGKSPRYAANEDRRLVAVFDDGRVELGQLERIVMNSEKGGANALPTFARLRAAVAADDKLTMELMSVDIRPEQFVRLAGAARAEIQIGATRFALNDVHMGILREFASYVIPQGWTPQQVAGGAAGAGVAPPPGVAEPTRAETPSDANNAPLEDTLKWLKKELSKNGTITRNGRTERLETVAFSSCEIRYRVAPIVVQAPPGPATDLLNAPGYRYVPPTLDYSLNLADLDPQGVRAGMIDDGAMISFLTRDGAPKITKKTTDNSEGRVTLHYEDQKLSGGFLNLRKTQIAPDIAVALTHAIRLCQKAN